MSLFAMLQTALADVERLTAEIAAHKDTIARWSALASGKTLDELERLKADSDAAGTQGAPPMDFCQKQYWAQPAPPTFARDLCPGWPASTLDVGGDANNAPYGVTLAGWSAQDHQGADLSQPGNAKYLVFAYLSINHIMPTPGWAPQAVLDLQAVQPGVPWVASDAETLAFGDEFVHLADNGHGMTPGTFNPNACGTEFFWGSQT